MSKELEVVIAVVVGAILYLITYYGILKLAENNHWLYTWLKISLFVLIVFIIGIGVTILFAYLTPRTVMTFVIVSVWGLGIGICSGLIHYKLNYHTKKGGQ